MNIGKDIAPLRPGHTLVIPKVHHRHISELPEEYAAALGLVVTRVAKAVVKGLATDENIPITRFADRYTMRSPRVSWAERRREPRLRTGRTSRKGPSTPAHTCDPFSDFLFPRFTTTSFLPHDLTPRETRANTGGWTPRLK